MANPRRPGAGAGPVSDVLPPEPPPPMDPDELKQIQMLAEAVLVSFSASPNPIPPFGRAELRWEVRMPTTMLPGVYVEVHLYEGGGDELVMTQGTRRVTPYGETKFAIYLKSPKAQRHLGTVSVTVDLGSCRMVKAATGLFVIPQIKAEAEKPFPSGGDVTLRGGGATVDIGINSFVVDIPLKASVPNWFDPDIDVTMGFNLGAENGQLQAKHNLAKTDVSQGTLSTILSVGCASKVAEAVEATSDGYLKNSVGPEVARRMRDGIQRKIDETLKEINQGHSANPFKLYDISLTQDEMIFRFCPSHPTP